LNQYYVSVQKGAVTILAEPMEATDSVQILLKLALRPELQAGYHNISVRLIGEAPLPGEVMELLEPADGLSWITEEQWQQIEEIGKKSK
jgi:hypothetical protein